MLRIYHLTLLILGFSAIMAPLRAQFLKSSFKSAGSAAVNSLFKKANLFKPTAAKLYSTKSAWQNVRSFASAHLWKNKKYYAPATVVTGTTGAYLYYNRDTTTSRLIKKLIKGRVTSLPTFMQNFLTNYFPTLRDLIFYEQEKQKDPNAHKSTYVNDVFFRHPSKEPKQRDDMTQSEACLLADPRRVDGVRARNKENIRKDSRFHKLLFTLNQEDADWNKKGYTTFIHAQKSEIAFYVDFANEAMKNIMKYNIPDDFFLLRFPTERHPQDYCEKSQDINFLKSNQKGQEHLLFMNAFFAGDHHVDGGEDSLRFFYENHNVFKNNVDIIPFGLGYLYDEFKVEIEALRQEYCNLDQAGCMIHIKIPNNRVKDFVYISLPDGFGVKVEKWESLTIQNIYDDPYSFIQALKANPKDICSFLTEPCDTNKRPRNAERYSLTTPDRLVFVMPLNSITLDQKSGIKMEAHRLTPKNHSSFLTYLANRDALLKKMARRYEEHEMQMKQEETQKSFEQNTLSAIRDMF